MKACATCIRGPERVSDKIGCRFCGDDLLNWIQSTEDERINVIGTNGNTGDHYLAVYVKCFGQYMLGQDAGERDCDNCKLLHACQTETPPRITQTPTHNSASGFLRRADQIMEERGKTYDAPAGERSMARTVQAFNMITSNDLTEAEGWLLMQLLKDVRQWQRPAFHQDSADDGVAYAALKAEALANGS